MRKFVARLNAWMKRDAYSLGWREGQDVILKALEQRREELRRARKGDSGRA